MADTVFAGSRSPELSWRPWKAAPAMISVLQVGRWSWYFTQATGPQNPSVLRHREGWSPDYVSLAVTVV